MQCAAVCCSVLQCASVCSSVLQCLVVCCSDQNYRNIQDYIHPSRQSTTHGAALSPIRFSAHCNILQHTATHTATHYTILHLTALHCTPMQHTATHCNSPQHTATHCNTPHYTATYCNTSTCESEQNRLSVPVVASDESHSAASQLQQAHDSSSPAPSRCEHHSKVSDSL